MSKPCMCEQNGRENCPEHWNSAQPSPEPVKVWGCGACGKSAPDPGRATRRVVSCRTWANEVWEETIRRREDGSVCFAVATTISYGEAMDRAHGLKVDP